MSFSGPPATHAQLGRLGLGALCVGSRAEDQAAVQLSSAPPGPYVGVTLATASPPRSRAGGLDFPQKPAAPSPPLASKVLGHSREHSLWPQPCRTPMGGHWKKGRQALLQSVPVVLC